MRFLHLLLAGAVLSTGAAVSPAIDNALAATRGADDAVALGATCAARAPEVAGTRMAWHAAEAGEMTELSRWCRAVGSPVYVSQPVGLSSPAPPALDELVTLSWNAHLAEGELSTLVNDLRAGRLTGGRPVQHFVLLVQELYRRGPDVPTFSPADRTAFAIVPRDPDAPDAEDYARELGLSFLYVPSMRNGAQMPEDRGSAIISTEPLLDPIALELPLARQRRVAVGAAVHVRFGSDVARLELLNAHLEPLSSPKSLWIFRNPRTEQMRAILDLLAKPRYSSADGVVLGGDMNTVRAGAGEDAYEHARAWSRSLRAEDRRDTHFMGRLDYLFFRLEDGWSGTTTRLDDRFGSDHYPVLGRFVRAGVN